MCLFLIEILFFIAGLWLIVSGKVPEGLFVVLFGKGKYELPAVSSRLFGLLLAVPFPAAFLVSFAVSFLFDSDSMWLAAGFEILCTVTVAVAAVLIARKSRREPEGGGQSAIEPGK
ncbi:MAG: hypothetical protein JW929_14160 [Anaerolineales bacterium]|nr:hypothetical protein [Anaerolineales bacterium]